MGAQGETLPPNKTKKMEDPQDETTSPTAPPEKIDGTMKSLRCFGYEVFRVREETAWRMLYGGALGLVLLNSVTIPFLLPKLKRFLGAPYLPSSRKAVDALFSRVLPEAARCGPSAV